MIFIVTLILRIVRYLRCISVFIETVLRQTKINSNCRCDSFPGSFNKCFNLFCCILLDVPFLSWFSLDLCLYVCVCESVFFFLLFHFFSLFKCMEMFLLCFALLYFAWDGFRYYSIAFIVDSSAFCTKWKQKVPKPNIRSVPKLRSMREYQSGHLHC